MCRKIIKAPKKYKRINKILSFSILKINSKKKIEIFIKKNIFFVFKYSFLRFDWDKLLSIKKVKIAGIINKMKSKEYHTLKSTEKDKSFFRV